MYIYFHVLLSRFAWYWTLGIRNLIKGLKAQGPIRFSAILGVHLASMAQPITRVDRRRLRRKRWNELWWMTVGDMHAVSHHGRVERAITWREGRDLQGDSGSEDTAHARRGKTEADVRLAVEATPLSHKTWFARQPAKLFEAITYDSVNKKIITSNLNYE